MLRLMKERHHLFVVLRNIVIMATLMFREKKNGKRLFHFTVCFFFVRIMAASTKDDMDRIGLFKEMEYVTIKDPYKETAKCKSVENFMHEHVTWRFVFFL